MGILNTQRISSVVPGTETEEIFIEATEYSPGKFCCDVDTIGEQLRIDRAIALSYHVNGKEADFITYGERYGIQQCLKIDLGDARSMGLN